MGYKLAGCEVLGCCEIDKRMNDVYVANHHPKYNFLMDIRDFNKIPDEEIPDELKDLDILDGSPPCTTFSMAGDREKSWGKLKKFREGQKEQTLDDLSFVFIETVGKLRPKVVIMENVEGLINGGAWKYVQKIYTRFDAIGYRVKHWLLKGETMGVPQTRHRVFFVAIRKDINPGLDLYGLDMCFNYEPIPYGQIKEGEGKKINEKSRTYSVLLQCKESDSFFYQVTERTEGKRTLFNYQILWDDKVATTITAGSGPIAPMRGKEKTYISVKDLLNMQTFPSDYAFPSRTHTAVRYICGMSVPPIMIKRIMTRLIEKGVFKYKNLGKEYADMLKETETR